MMCIGYRLHYGTVAVVYVYVQTAVGPDNVVGYDAVQQLAHFLVSLAGEAYITSEQVDIIVGMWQELDPYDKQRINTTAILHWISFN